ncbi:alpha-hydroxy acid oxidase [Actinokineospora sp. NPDC004072]
MSTPASLDDFRAAARGRLPQDVFDYIDGGACDEITLAANRRDFDAIALSPLCLRDVREVDLTTAVLGQTCPLPLGISPTALHRLVADEGEVATARAAAQLRVPMVVSAMSSVALAEVAEHHTRLWLQTYLFEDRGVTLDLVRRAEEAGYRAVVLTVGCPVAGKRDKNIRNRFTLPPGVSAANFAQRNRVDHNNPIHSFDGAALDPSATWPDVERLRAATDLPVVLKGIVNPRDVGPALDVGASALVVSNHGGRQLDTTVSAIRALPEVAAAAAGRLPLLVDSGFRRGTDVLKALALGADAVLLGRPVLWALAAGGAPAVVDALTLLADELRTAMRLVGCASIADLRREAAGILR